MLFLLSPAKALDYESPWSLGDSLIPTRPLFVDRSRQLIDRLRAHSPEQIAALMDLSEDLSTLNVARYKAWSTRFTAKNSRPAVLAFNGDAYGGLSASSLASADLGWLQAHLCILCGLYGVLRPLDWLQPYRLEMGTRLAHDGGSDLYSFWRMTLADYLNQRLRADASPLVVNLASIEYFKAVDVKRLKARVLHCRFEERRDGQYKVISFMAKRARGLMVRHAVQRRAMTPAALADFNEEGYALDAAASRADLFVFRREAQ